MADLVMKKSNENSAADSGGHVTANGARPNDNTQSGYAPAVASVDGEAKLRDSNQNKPEDSSAPSGASFSSPALDDGGGDGDSAPSDGKLGSTTTDGGEPGTIVGSKKKKKKGGKNSKAPTALNKIRGTGFEENFADPPMTPGEYQEERILYDSEKYPFVERIEECIRRFRGRRRMDQARTYMFDRYLNLGGIDTSQRQFQGASGLASDALDRLDTDERRLAASNDIIHRRGDDRRYYDPGEEGWHVDFTGIVSCYCSRTLPHDVGGDAEYIEMGADLILNWLNYLVHHDVCPEYADDLARACRVCLAAKSEFPDINAALSVGIGQFNYACRRIFNQPAAGPDGWVDRIAVDPARAHDADDPAHDPAAGKLEWPVVFGATMALLGGPAVPPPPPPSGGDDDGSCSAAARLDVTRWVDDDPSLKAMAAGVTGVGVREEVFEVVEVREPDARVCGFFRRLRTRDGVVGCYNAPAVVVVRPAIIEDGWANTPKPSGRATAGGAGGGGEHGKEQGDKKKEGVDEKVEESAALEEYIFDHATIASKLRPGMKLRLETAEVAHPEFRFKFVRQLVDIVPSFYTFLPQELMVNFKEPIETDRDPASVVNPNGKVGSGPSMEIYTGGQCEA